MGTLASVSRSTASSRPRHCRSVPAYVCTLRAGPSCAGRPAATHAHRSSERAPVAARGWSAVHTRAPELHHRDGPVGGDGRLVREQPGGQLALGPGHRGGRELDAGHGARQHPAHVGVEHDVPLPVGERRDGRRGVVADAGQRPQRVVRRRHLAVVAFHDRLSGGVQAQRPSRVAEPAPGPDRLAGRFCGEGGRGRPRRQPGGPDGQHAGDRRLLEHELADQDPPRGRPGGAPRQVARVLVVPAEHWFVQVAHRSGRYPGVPPRSGAGRCIA